MTFIVFTVRGDKKQLNLSFASKHLFFICRKSSVSHEFLRWYISNADIGHFFHRRSIKNRNGESQSVYV